MNQLMHLFVQNLKTLNLCIIHQIKKLPAMDNWISQDGVRTIGTLWQDSFPYLESPTRTVSVDGIFDFVASAAEACFCRLVASRCFMLCFAAFKRGKLWDLRVHITFWMCPELLTTEWWHIQCGFFYTNTWSLCFHFGVWFWSTIFPRDIFTFNSLLDSRMRSCGLLSSLIPSSPSF